MKNETCFAGKIVVERSRNNNFSFREVLAEMVPVVERSRNERNVEMVPVVERTVTEVSHMDERVQVEVVETTYSLVSNY